MINWNKVSTKDALIINEIAKRAAAMANKTGAKVDKLTVNMDITACHVSGCKLKLQALLDADDFDFAHDISGIGRHINRDTGKLENCFLPRFAV